MSLADIEWTESEGDTDDNLALENIDDSSESDFDKIKISRSRGDPSRGPRRVRDEVLDPEIEEAYQNARQLYTQGDYDGALVLLEEAIKHEAGSKLLFNLLASIHEERRDLEKALLARIHVAALDKRDKDTWIDVAERSVQLGHLGQAAWCFQQVSRLDRENWQWLRLRVDLHTQLGQHSAALTLLQRIRAKFFRSLPAETKTQVLLGIAGALKELGRSDEALKIYTDIFLAATSPSLPTGEVDLDWQNLNILCELLTDQKQPTRVVTVVKTGARYINGRGSELFWQQFSAETDAEFDQRRRELLRRLSPSDREWARRSIDTRPDSYDMPIDIRIWLLQARLKLIPPHLLLQARNAAVLESLPAVKDALYHLAYLRECRPVETFSDLFKKGALAFFEARLYAESRELYLALTDIEHESEEEYLAMTVQVAKCEMELHNVSRAENLYAYVLDRDPVNQEALVAMGEIYAATNRKEESMTALKKLEAVRSAQQLLDATNSGNGANSSLCAGNGLEGRQANIESSNFFEHDLAARQNESARGNVFVENSRPRAPNARLTRAERAEIERSAQAKADTAFAGLARYQSGVDAVNTVATREWLRLVDELVDMFASHRKFFPADKQKDFFEGSSNTTVDQRIARLRLAQLNEGSGERRKGARNSAEDIDSMIDEDEDMDEDIDDEDIDDEDMEEEDDADADADNEDDTENIDTALRPKPRPRRRGRIPAQMTKEERESFVWRGQPLSMWFWVFMQGALVHAKSGQPYRAQHIVSTAQQANVFNFDDHRVETMQFVGLSCAYIAKRPAMLSDLLRHVHTSLQFNPMIYRLYVALLGGSVNFGREALEVFGSNNNQKFFLRQIKAMDSLIHYKKPVSGMAKVIDPQNAPTSEDPQMLMLYVYIMLLGPSYAPALTYLIRTRSSLPRHPLVLMIYGVVQMHRVTQRTSLNRHLQLLEGLSFMQDYAALRINSVEERQEVSYNMGRFFHGVGLSTLAIRYYTETLTYRSSVAPEHDLSYEAAYNLHLIYAESGNMRRSMEIVNEYLVI